MPHDRHWWIVFHESLNGLQQMLLTLVWGKLARKPAYVNYSVEFKGKCGLESSRFQAYEKP